ncbi:MAG: 3-(methylsulfanyl)propanoyl-CoA dehydrogenase, partial [Acidimicrobiaceae bacterium]
IGGLLDRMAALDSELAVAGDELASVRAALADAVDGLRTTTTWLLEHGAAAPVDALAGATPYLRQWGIVIGGWVLARQALAALPGASGDESLAAKLTTARFYCEQLLPQAAGLAAAVTAGADRLLELTPAQLRSS